jgi:hypothetical protein
VVFGILLNFRHHPAEKAMVKSPSATPLEQRGTTVDREFAELMERLQAAYEPWDLMRILLTQKLNRFDTPVKLGDLASLARATFLDLHKHEAVDAANPRFSPEAFRKDVLNVLSGAQGRLVDFYKNGANSQGFMLLLSGDAVRWAQWRHGIEKAVAEETAASTPLAS